MSYKLLSEQLPVILGVSSIIGSGLTASRYKVGGVISSASTVKKSLPTYVAVLLAASVGFNLTNIIPSGKVIGIVKVIISCVPPKVSSCVTVSGKKLL